MAKKIDPVSWSFLLCPTKEFEMKRHTLKSERSRKQTLITGSVKRVVWEDRKRDELSPSLEDPLRRALKTAFISRLNADGSIGTSIGEGGDDLTILSDRDKHCWIIQKVVTHELLGQSKVDLGEVRRLLGPTGRQWEGLVAIAEVLLSVDIAMPQDNSAKA